MLSLVLSSDIQMYTKLYISLYILIPEHQFVCTYTRTCKLAPFAVHIPVQIYTRTSRCTYTRTNVNPYTVPYSVHTNIYPYTMAVHIPVHDAVDLTEHPVMETLLSFSLPCLLII